MKAAFLTSTMFSRSNGPASFAKNLFDSQELNQKKQFHFYTEDCPSNGPNLTKVDVTWANRFPAIGMLLRAVDYFRAVKEHHHDVYIWNFSVLSWYGQSRLNGKHIVFVNDPFSLDTSTAKGNYSKIRLKVFRYFEKLTCKRATCVIANSKVLKRKLIETYDLSQKKVHVVEKGIRIEDHYVGAKDSYLLDTSKVKVLFVKSNYEVGGLGLLISALNKISTHSFLLTIIGPAHVPYHNLENVELNVLGRCSREDIYHQMAASDLFCVPNREEAFGQVNVEAITCGTPTVLVPSDFQLSLHDKEYAYFAEGFTSKELSKAIAQFLQLPPSEKKQRAELGAETMLKRYSFDSSYRELVQILEGV